MLSIILKQQQQQQQQQEAAPTGNSSGGGGVSAVRARPQKNYRKTVQELQLIR